MTDQPTVWKTPHLIVKEYERHARRNRPDWDQFVSEARADKNIILVEVYDHIDDFYPNLGLVAEWDLTYYDALSIAVREWIDSL